jgi:hypothetical protein
MIPAATAGEANGASDSSGITAGASTGDEQDGTAGGTARGGGATPMCTPAIGGEPGPVTWRPVPESLQTTEQRRRASEETGGWYWRFCGDQSDVKIQGTDNGAVWFPAGTGGGGADPRTLAAQALQRTPLPDPVIRMSPEPPVPQLVGLATYLWVDPAGWGPRTASASAGGVTSTVTATPERVVWDMGQGETVVCRGPGRPYAPGVPADAPGACTFTYRFSSARSARPDRTFTVTATVHWHATWTATGAPGGGDLGTVERSASVGVLVAELQSLNVNPRANS